VLVALIAAVLLAAAPAAEARVFIPSCGSTVYGGRVEPPRWDAGCTGTPELIHAKWTGWGRRVAVGRGFTVVTTCDSDCTVSKYRSRLRVSRIRRCKSSTGELKRFYTRGRLRFLASDDSDVQRFAFVCVR
jgi:hypothetical protein